MARFFNAAGRRVAVDRSQLSTDAANLEFAFRAFAPRRMAITASMAIIALVMPDVPGRVLVAAICAVSAVLQFLVFSRVAPSRKLGAFAIADTFMAMLAGLLVPELWVISLIVAVGAIMIASTAEPDFPRTASMTTFAMGATPGFVAIGEAAMPSISAAIGVLLIDRWLKKMIALVTMNEKTTLTKALETSASLVHVSNLTSGHTITVQGPIESITGYTPLEWIERDHRELIHPDDLDTFWVDLSAVEPGDSFDRKARFRHADGHWIWLRDLSVVSEEAGGQLHLRGFTVDVTEVEEAHAVIRHQAETDSLTGLANRGVLVDHLERLRVDGTDFALFLMDLDRFKLINDTMGHPVGDEVLREIARRLVDLAAPDDLVCRLGGDEFALVVPSATDRARAIRMALQIHAECTRSIRHGELSLQSDTSIGVVISTRPTDTPSSLMRRADLAMYRAKGENVPYRFFAEEMVETSIEDFRLSAALPEAIVSGELVLYFQPKVDLMTGEIVSFEGLVRWEHPTLGVLTPDRFLHLINVSDVERHFVDSVIDQGVAFAARCREASRHVSVAVNLSTQSFLDGVLPGRVDAALRKWRVPAELFVIEITELDIMDRFDGSASVMDRWSTLGIGISVDDFGTGYSSFSRLVDLPITEVKIDRRFVQGALTSRRDEIIVRSVSDLAHRMGIALVAEGVETDAQAQLLLGAGCRTAQGYRFAKALPADEALRLLSTTFDGWSREEAHSALAEAPANAPG